MASFVLSGGVGHDFESSTAALLELLPDGDDALVFGDPAELARLSDGEWGLLVVNALWWRMDAPKYDELRVEWARELPPEARAGIESHVEAGRPILGLHTAAICFDDHPRWGEILGGAWEWGRSSHPPLDDDEPVRVRVTGSSPLVAELPDFEVIDEVYGDLRLEPDVDALLVADGGAGEHPMLWARTLPAGSRVVYDALGHDRRSLDHPTHREILRRAIAWLTAPSEQPA